MKKSMKEAVQNNILKCFSCTSSKPDQSTNSENLSTSKSHEHPWQTYTLKELLLATNHFHEENKLGEGGFGIVYYGRTNKGVEIAVKRLKTMTPKAEMEFAIEVEILGRVRHKNLLSLRGFYAGGKERLIVYDYMPNQSLLALLHRRSNSANHISLDWTRRMNIALGSAKGIAYLHHQASPHIIHRDIKASNVLLDSNFRPKVADFGFAKLIPEGVSQLTTKVKGTVGYLAPEYAMWGKVSESCDVYSFGILLLEIVSARKPIEKLQGGVKRDIVQWVTPWIENGGWDKIVDPRLGDKYDKVQARNMTMVAMRCTNINPENRPAMREVVEFLNGGMGERRTKEVMMMQKVNSEEDGQEINDASQQMMINRRRFSRTR